MNKKISLGVIVPFYNEEQFLEESVSRLLKLDIVDQIILVDDCSPDNGEIKNYFINSKKDFKDIKVFYFSKNLGYVNSVNCILSNATGNKIIFVSNDIFINPYYLEEVINILFYIVKRFIIFSSFCNCESPMAPCRLVILILKPKL